MKKIFWIYGWIFVLPRRWFFWQMMRASCGPRLWPKKEDFFGWQWPNLHWWILYKTVFRFFKWLFWDGWRPLAVWENGFRTKMPWYAEMVRKIGQTTAGFTICGGECAHCGFDAGDQVELSEDESEFFILEEAWTVGTQDGTDHRFRGTTICPVCDHRQQYEDGSL